MLLNKKPNILQWLCVIIICTSPVSPQQIFRGYYSSGKLKYKAKDEKDKRVIREYFPSGKLHFVAVYEDGRLNGVMKEFYENGTLKSEIPYHKGEKDGFARFYYQNGMLMCKIEYDDNKETGNIKIYNREGIVTNPSNGSIGNILDNSILDSFDSPSGVKKDTSK